MKERAIEDEVNSSDPEPLEVQMYRLEVEAKTCDMAAPKKDAEADGITADAVRLDADAQTRGDQCPVRGTSSRGTYTTSFDRGRAA
jgi:hypothetical protein